MGPTTMPRCSPALAVRQGVDSAACFCCPTPQVVDGPNDEGEMFTRPGRLSDKLPEPYANEQVCAVFSSCPSPCPLAANDSLSLSGADGGVLSPLSLLWG